VRPRRNEDSADARLHPQDRARDELLRRASSPDHNGTRPAHLSMGQRWRGQDDEALTEKQIAREIIGPDIVTRRIFTLRWITDATKNGIKARDASLGSQAIGILRRVR
jgi:hypothetical protein